MDKRFQVFVSSTFLDLREERQAAVRGILGTNHMPAGMELFPASDESAWSLIQRVIDESDYYVLIMGGRYGSLGGDGVGYTEREYDYAVSQKKPVIALLHRSPEKLAREKTETTEDSWQKLEVFRKKVESRHHCALWATAEELEAKVILGLIAAVNASPASGWIRADQVPTDATIGEVLTLRNRIAELEKSLNDVRVTAPPEAHGLASGDDSFSLRMTFQTVDPVTYVRTGFRTSISVTWDEIFVAVSPTLINEASDVQLRGALLAFCEPICREKVQDLPALLRRRPTSFQVEQKSIDTCVVQFRALGLITESVRSRSVKDTSTYWKLTPYGDHRMTQIRAMRTASISDPDTSVPEDNVEPETSDE